MEDEEGGQESKPEPEDLVAYGAAAALLHVLGKGRGARMLRRLRVPWLWRTHLVAWHDKVWEDRILSWLLRAAQELGFEDPEQRLFEFLVSGAERTGACGEGATHRLAEIGEALHLDEETVRRALRPLEIALSLSQQEAAAILGLTPNASRSKVESAYRKAVSNLGAGQDPGRLLAARIRLLSGEARRSAS